MLKVGFIGAGNYGINHIKNVASLDFAQVCAITDKNMESAQKAQRVYGGTAYGDIAEMLEKETLDACFISLPAFAHGEPEFMTIDRGIPVCIDKPVSNNLDTAYKIQDMLENKKIINSVGYQWRYFDLVSRIKETICGSNVIMCMGYWLSTLPPGMPWWGKKEFSGGQIVEQATHLFDTVRFLFGDPAEMQAYSNPSFFGNDEINIESASTVNMRYTGGLIANVACVCALPVRYKCELTILTDKEVIELVSLKSGMMNYILNIIDKNGKQTVYPARDPVLELDKTFLHAVKNNDPGAILCPYSEAVKTLKLTVEVYDNKKILL